MLSVIFTVALVGMIVWGIETFVPLDPKFQQAIRAIALIGTFIYILDAFGLLHLQLR